MHTIKEIFNILDSVFAIFWGYTLIDLGASITTSGFVFSTIDNVIKVLFALVGLVYTMIRMHHFFLKSRLERAKMREELEILERENSKKD